MNQPTNGHRLYRDFDNGRPDAICDRDGRVMLPQCKACGATEPEMDERPECSAADGVEEAPK